MSEERCVLDIEVAKNRCIIGIKQKGEKGETFDLTAPMTTEIHQQIDNRLNHGREVSTYNGSRYDNYILAAAMDGAPPSKIYDLSKTIIEGDEPAWKVARDFYVPKLGYNDIDLSNYVPKTRLKTLEGRLGIKIKDLPFDPHKPIMEDQVDEVVAYLHDDLVATEALRDSLQQEIDVRYDLESIYGLEGLARKTSASVAAEVLIHEYLKAQDYDDPEATIYEDIDDVRAVAKKQQNMEFEFEVLPWVRAGIKGTIAEPLADQIDGSVFKIRNGYRVGPDKTWPSELILDDSGELISAFGLGGLHTKDSGFDFTGFGFDVASMYPSIILGKGCSPWQLEESIFHDVYRGVIQKRMEHKRAGDKREANALKLILNSTFGAMNYAWSPLYSPREFLQITITGQLSLIALSDKTRKMK